MRENMMLWVGCIAGALQDTEYSSKLAGAGFEAIDIEADAPLQNRRCPRIS